jgi:isochorismate synthase EntC
MITVERENLSLYRQRYEGALNLHAFTGLEGLLYWKNKEGTQYIGLGRCEKILNEEMPFFHYASFEGEHTLLFCPLVFKITNTEIVVFEQSGHDPLSILGVNVSDFIKKLSLSKEEVATASFKLAELSPTFERWQERVNESLETEGLKKSVLCRKFTYEGHGPKNSFDFFLELKTKNAADLFHCYFDDFMSFTPESLIKLEGNQCRLEAIAGTHKNDGQEEELLHDPKERREHLEVISSLEELASKVGKVRKGETALLKLKTLSHLRTPLSLELEEGFDRQKLYSLILSLHPTPAVGGTPKEMALEFIMKEEGERGPYAGFFGVEEQDYLELSVLIRSLHYHCQKVVAYGGAGIVEGSSAKGEWQETFNKVKSFLPSHYFDHELSKGN